MSALRAANLGVGLHFKALHLHRRPRDHGATAAVPRATAASHAILSLPLFPAMTQDDVRDVVDTLADVLPRHAA
jgi:UDP-4-amino-4-deoxy-L-arabinose-oxoglutarate aminotransferase